MMALAVNQGELNEGMKLKIAPGPIPDPHLEVIL
jgi:hypothetical protein